MLTRDAVDEKGIQAMALYPGNKGIVALDKACNDVLALCATVRELRKLIDDDLSCAQAEECHKEGGCPTCEVHLRIEEVLK